MSAIGPETIYRRRGTDHLGFLGAKLRDLLGYSTLAYELIQNADDAPNTTSMSFDVRDDALIVDNNGSFADCNSLEEFECPWKRDPAKNRMCDFHRFQNVASGDKREEANTTGAFGIGFTAVYQITDQPQLVSSNRHWTICEDRPEEERIAECIGCEVCHAPTIPNTRFILPWASPPETILRKKLRVSCVNKEVPGEVFEELQRSIPTAMLFLKKLTAISLLRNGRVIRRFERFVDGNSLTLTDNQQKS